jgi:hypothetical protein
LDAAGERPQEERLVYQFSRAIYRSLADDIEETRGGLRDETNHERVLRACEAAIERLANDGRYFARPTRTLFNDIRTFFPVCAQNRLYRVIDSALQACDEFLARQPRTGFDLAGNPLQCRATTRKGTPCQRMPLPVNGYCPSHQHLAETEEVPARLAA